MYGYNQLLFVMSHWKFAYSGQPLYWAKMPWNQSGPIKRHPLYSRWTGSHSGISGCGQEGCR